MIYGMYLLIKDWLYEFKILRVFCLICYFIFMLNKLLVFIGLKIIKIRECLCI